MKGDYPLGTCQCGCGGTPAIAKQSNSYYGYRKGQPMFFLPGHQRVNSLQAQFNAKTVRDDSGCLLWTGLRTSTGYGKVTYRGKTEKAHRVAWRLHTGADPGRLSVLHKCDTPLCVNPDHLFVGTNADNIRDKVAKGRHNYGEKVYCAILTDDQVRQIRAAPGLDREIAEQFKIARTTVNGIKNRNRWKHVQ